MPRTPGANGGHGGAVVPLGGPGRGSSVVVVVGLDQIQLGHWDFGNSYQPRMVPETDAGDLHQGRQIGSGYRR